MHTYQSNSGEVTIMSWNEYQRKKNMEGLEKYLTEEPNMRKSKYGNKRVEIDGHKFDSKAEAKYYGQLKMRKLAKEIIGFEMQVPYDLVVNGVLIGKYKADFLIQYSDRKEVIDVKGVKTPVYQLKKKLMKAIYGITIIEV